MNMQSCNEIKQNEKNFGIINKMVQTERIITEISKENTETK